jgi:hypothetical protein
LLLSFLCFAITAAIQIFGHRVEVDEQPLLQGIRLIIAEVGFGLGGVLLGAVFCVSKRGGIFPPLQPSVKPQKSGWA